MSDEQERLDAAVAKVLEVVDACWRAGGEGDLWTLPGEKELWFPDEIKPHLDFNALHAAMAKLRTEGYRFRCYGDSISVGWVVLDRDGKHLFDVDFEPESEALAIARCIHAAANHEN